jgi:hypothetical protein
LERLEPSPLLFSFILTKSGEEQGAPNAAALLNCDRYSMSENSPAVLALATLHTFRD